jgi:hypothetical protein
VTSKGVTTSGVVVDTVVATRVPECVEAERRRRGRECDGGLRAPPVRNSSGKTE